MHRGAETGLAELYDEARGEVSLERGTSMYLKRYQHEWTQVMALLTAGESPTDGRRDQLQQRLAELDEIAGKLRH